MGKVPGIPAPGSDVSSFQNWKHRNKSRASAHPPPQSKCPCLWLRITRIIALNDRQEWLEKGHNALQQQQEQHGRCIGEGWCPHQGSSRKKREELLSRSLCVHFLQCMVRNPCKYPRVLLFVSFFRSFVISLFFPPTTSLSSSILCLFPAVSSLLLPPPPPTPPTETAIIRRIVIKSHQYSPCFETQTDTFQLPRLWSHLCP